MLHPLSARVTTCPDVMFRMVGDEAVLLNLNTELYLGLDPVGARMWTVLHESLSIEASLESLLTEFDVAPEQLRSDLDEFLNRLLEQGLITISPGEELA